MAKITTTSMLAHTTLPRPAKLLSCVMLLRSHNLGSLSLTPCTGLRIGNANTRPHWCALRACGDGRLGTRLLLNLSLLF